MANPPLNGLNELQVLKIIAGVLSGTGGIPTIPGAATGTLFWIHVSSGGTAGTVNGSPVSNVIIPTNAKGWTFNFIGTGIANTMGGNSAASGGQGFGGNFSPASPIILACDASTTLDGFYYT